jgi:hypothetical protein
MEVKDILLDDNLDLVIDKGDFKVGESDQQSQVLIINTNLGDWKQFPLTGVGINQYLGSSGQSDVIKRAIGIQLSADGFKVNEVIVRANNGESYEYGIDAIRE